MRLEEHYGSWHGRSTIAFMRIGMEVVPGDRSPGSLVHD